jgi:hypothetical protein
MWYEGEMKGKIADESSMKCLCCICHEPAVWELMMDKPFPLCASHMARYAQERPYYLLHQEEKEEMFNA